MFTIRLLLWEKALARKMSRFQIKLETGKRERKTGKRGVARKRRTMLRLRQLQLCKDSKSFR